jgi:hypothetical protein
MAAIHISIVVCEQNTDSYDKNVVSFNLFHIINGFGSNSICFCEGKLVNFTGIIFLSQEGCLGHRKMVHVLEILFLR